MEKTKLENILTELAKSINIIIGALCTIMGGVIQNKYNENYKKKRLYSEKLERIYFLCQAVFDGHKNEIRKALMYLPTNKEMFLKNRNHPGKESSELKMLIKSYIPENKNLLIKYDEGHQRLKQDFYSIEQEILENEHFDKYRLEEYNKNWIEYIKILGIASDQIKDTVALKLNKMIK